MKDKLLVHVGHELLILPVISPAKVSLECIDCSKVNVDEDLIDRDKLLAHIEHELEIVTYGLDGQTPVNVSLECIDCMEVIADEDLLDIESE